MATVSGLIGLLRSNMVGSMWLEQSAGIIGYYIETDLTLNPGSLGSLLQQNVSNSTGWMGWAG